MKLTTLFLEQKIACKTAERDMLKAQFDQLGPEQGFIRENAKLQPDRH
jgi:hypothetical protein